MKCKSCGFDNMDGANFCVNCGAKLEKEPEETPVVENKENSAKEEAAIRTDQAEPAAQKAADAKAAGTEPVNADASENQETDSDADENLFGEEWFYVDNGQSSGPYTRSWMEEKYKDGFLKDDTYVWKSGLENWVYYRDSGLKQTSEDDKKANAKETVYRPEKTLEEINAEAAEEPASEPETPEEAGMAFDDETASEWFYVDNGKSAGPYPQDAMKQLIQTGQLNGHSFVWKEGMNDWARLDSTVLGKYLNTRQASYSQSYSGVAGASKEADYTDYRSNSGSTYYGYQSVQPRSVILYIILSVLTCGIWYLVWVYQLASDINKLAERQGRPKGLDPILSLILILVSCSIFQIFFFWKEENAVSQLTSSRYTVQNQSVLTGLLALFCPVASAAIIQDQINSIIRYE